MLISAVFHHSCRGTTTLPMRQSGIVRSCAVLLAAASLVMVAPALAATDGAVQSAINRPAVSVRAPGRVVLLSAALAGGRLVAVGERGIIALSDDGGLRWRQAPTPTSVTLTAVRFADARRGWAIGHGGVVLMSEDGGEHWTQSLDGRRAAQLVLEAARSGSDGKALADAERLVADGPDKPFLDLLVLDASRLVIVGAYGLALASEDGGRTWASWVGRLPNPKGLHLYTARNRGDTLLLAGEQGLVLMSRDGGHSFAPINAPYKGSFFSAELLDEREGIVLAGLRGNVIRSRDNGASWTVIVPPIPVTITATAVGQGGQLLAVNQAGFVMKLQGDRLVPVNTKPLPPLNGLLVNGNSLLALSIQGALSVPLTP